LELQPSSALEAVSFCDSTISGEVSFSTGKNQMFACFVLLQAQIKKKT